MRTENISVNGVLKDISVFHMTLGSSIFQHKSHTLKLNCEAFSLTDV